MPRLPFQTIQDLDLPITDVLGGRIGHVHDAFLNFPYEVREALPDEERDLVLVVGKNRRRTRLSEIAEHPGRVVVAFAPGDGPLHRRYTDERPGLPDNVVAAFSTNNEMDDPRAVSVPLGARTNKLPQLQFVRQNRREKRERLAYVNFAFNEKWYPPDADGRPHLRAQVVERFDGAPWLEMDISPEHRSDPADLIRFYSRIAAHKFVLSPPGNGTDCYRTWEILCLGAIPIVAASSPMSAFADLPILFTEDYSELSEQYLEQRWLEMSSASYEIDRMLRAWYADRFLAAVGKLDRPRFICWRIEDSPFERALRGLARSSRSSSGLVVETPTPPFTGRRSFLRPEDWRAGGGLELGRCDGGLEIRVREQGERALELPLETVAGARFRLTGRISPGEKSPTLTVEARERSEPLVSTELNGEAETELTLDFIARSSRTLLRLSVPAVASPGGLLLHDLELRARL